MRKIKARLKIDLICRRAKKGDVIFVNEDEKKAWNHILEIVDDKKVKKTKDKEETFVKIKKVDIKDEVKEEVKKVKITPEKAKEIYLEKFGKKVPNIKSKDLAWIIKKINS